MLVSKISELLTDKISGEWGEPDSFSGTAVNVIRTANFTNSGVISFEEIVKREINSQKVSRKKLLDGDIIIEKSGGSPSQPVGRVVYFENPDGNIYLCNNFTTVLRSDNKKVNSKYLFYLLYNSYQRGSVLEFQNKTTGILNLKLERYLDSEISYDDDLESQNKIVAILDKAKTILDKREESVKKYDSLLRATFLEMFGDLANNPKGLLKQPIKEFGDVITGNTPPRSEPANYDSNFIEWIKTDNILIESQNLSQASEYLSEIGFSKSRYVDKNALLVTCIAGSIGSIGRSAISNRRVAFNQQINAIVPKENISVYFLYWMFKVSADYIQSYATGGMKRLLTKGEFEKILLLKPSYDQQIKFEQIAITHSTFKAKLLVYRNTAENLLSSLSRQVFSDRMTIDVDAELDALIKVIDIEKRDEDNNIETITNDLTFLQRLIDKLQGQDFENADLYEKAKYIVFRLMKEEPDLIKQKFNNKEKKITMHL